MHGGGSTAEYFRPYIHPYHHSNGPYGYQQMFHQHPLAAAAAAQYSQYGASGSTSSSNQGSYSAYQTSGSATSSSSGTGVIAPQAQKLLPFAAPSTPSPGLRGLNSNVAQHGIGAYTTTSTATTTTPPNSSSTPSTSSSTESSSNLTCTISESNSSSYDTTDPTSVTSATEARGTSSAGAMLEMSPNIAANQHSPYSNLSSPARPQPTASNSSPMTSNNDNQHSPPHPAIASGGGSNTITPPPTVTQHHRSQTSSSSNSMNMYRDKLGLNSPQGHSPSMAPPTPPNSSASPATAMSQSPSARRSSGSSTSKFRYPSGSGHCTSPGSGNLGAAAAAAAAGFLPDGPNTSSNMSSRESTPLSSMSRLDSSGVPNVDISRVKMETNETKQTTSQSRDAIVNSAKSATSQPLLIPTTNSPSAFSADYEQYIQHPTMQPPSSHQSPHHLSQPQHASMHQQHLRTHHGGFESSYGADLTDPSSVLSSSHQNQQQNIILQRQLTHHHQYYQHQLGQHSYLSGTIHHQADGLMRTGDGMAIPSGTSGSTKRQHGSVKIGRRPSHLPKELKRVDKSLPPGWVRKLKQRKHGKQSGRWDVYIYSPCGVKFASRKKLKSFCEKNNLNYDVEDFDFTPYGRHMESRNNAKSSHGSSGGSSSNGSSNLGSAGRHNSSGSTGSESTNHTGSSPASLHNYSPPSQNYLAQTAGTGGMMPTTSYSGTDFNQTGPSTLGPSNSGSFGFDPRMENPPNVSTLDIPQSSAFGSANRTAGALIPGALPYQPGRGHHHPLKLEPGISNSPGSEFFPVDMAADILGDSNNSSASLLSSNLFSSSAGSYSDSSSDSKRPYPQQQAPMVQVPLSNISLGSRASEDEHDDNPSSLNLMGPSSSNCLPSSIKVEMAGSSSSKMTGFGTALNGLRALNSSQEGMFDDYNLYN